MQTTTATNIRKRRATEQKSLSLSTVTALPNTALKIIQGKGNLQEIITNLTITVIVTVTTTLHRRCRHHHHHRKEIEEHEHEEQQQEKEQEQQQKQERE